MPPPPPPPLPPPAGFGEPPKSSPAESLDRSALLSQIRLGTNLKKASTNDRSVPLVDNAKSSVASSGGSSSSAALPKANGMMSGGGMPLGGLFAQGMPKLRQTGGKFGQEVATSRTGFNTVNRTVNTKNQLNPPSSVIGGSHSNPSSPAALRNGPLFIGGAMQFGQNTPGLQKKSPFPNDVNTRGPPPPPPNPDRKPIIFGSDTGLNMAGRPSPPSKPPGVTRSASQTSLNSKPTVRKVAPSVRPPPPPKNTNGPPALPSKPPSLVRRQSFGGPDLRNGQLSCHPQPIVIDPVRLTNRTNAGPAPPPRNISVPSSLNHMNESGDHRQAPAAPPVPKFGNGPQAVASHYRTPNQLPRAPSVKPPPPPLRTPAPPTTVPPPLPHHRMTTPAPPSSKSAAPQPPVMNNPVPPPPPARNTSTIPRNANSHKNDDVEKRFNSQFCPIDRLPAPQPLRFHSKTYQAKAQAFRQRNPPPPPPVSVPNQQPSQVFLHIQLEQKHYTNTSATQC